MGLQDVVRSSAAGAQGEAGISPQGGIDALLQQAIVERAIGSAVLEKLRGEADLPSEIYQIRGGRDQEVLEMLRKLDTAWPDADFSHALRAVEASNVGSFAEVYGLLGENEDERSLIERTIGLGVLSRMNDKDSDLTDVYRSLGGCDPTSISIFSNCSTSDQFGVEGLADVKG